MFTLVLLFSAATQLSGCSDSCLNQSAAQTSETGQNETDYSLTTIPLNRNGIELHLDRMTLKDSSPQKNILLTHGVTYAMASDYLAWEDWHMYQMNPAPLKKDLQEYISAYCLIQDDRYLAAFLHYYEETFNQNVLKYMRRYFMMEHFTDMKQAYVMGLLKVLKHYDITQGSKFTAFKERYAEREILNYVRSSRTGFTAQSLAEFSKLRRAMAIWDKFDRDYSDKTLSAVANELGESLSNTQEILLSGLLNEHQAEMYRQYLDSDGIDGLEETLADSTSNPCMNLLCAGLYTRG